MTIQISIIIPLYEVENYIERCLRSIIKQTFSDYEVILVDDCSQDNSLQVAEQFLVANNISFQSIRHTANKKQGAARNSGLKFAKGEYVFFVDADDELADTNTLQVLYSEMAKADYDFVTAKAQHIVNGEETIKPRANNAVTVLDEGSVLRAFGNNKIAPVVWNKLIRKTFLLANNIQFVEHTSFEDIPYCFILCCEANKVALINQITYRYHFADNDGATTASLDDDKIQNAMAMCEALLTYVAENNVVATVGIYPIYQVICRVMSYVLAHHSLIIDKERWIKCYAGLQRMYNESLLFDYSKRLRFSAGFAYYLAYKPYALNRSNIVNNIYSKVLLAIRMYNIRGGAALVHQFLQKT